MWILLFIGIATVGMFFVSRKAELSYQMGEVLPPSDPVYSDYKKFRSIFGEEANVLVIAISDKDFFKKENLVRWMAFEKKLSESDSVDWTLSVTSGLNLVKNEKRKEFTFGKIISKPPETQAECDSLENLVMNLPFYDGILYDKKSHSYILLAGLDKEIIQRKERIQVINKLQKTIREYEEETGKEIHISGLPFIRTDTIQKSSKEIVLFVGLAAAITAIILLIFFKSFWGIVVPLLVVAIGVIWSTATLVLFGYNITTLTGLIPPLLIVIGIPNSVFMITKYHQEYLKHGNKIRALTRIIEKTGKAIFLTNLTTAIGFGTLIITNSKMLKEFGVVAFINIMLLFVLSICLIPIFFSLVPAPSRRSTRHLTTKRAGFFQQALLAIARRFRPAIFVVASIIVVVSIYGISRLKTSGKVADDVPKDSRTYKDLEYFETHFNGVLPFEILIDTKKKKGAYTNAGLIRKVDALQDSISKYPEFSRAVSVVDLVKFANQSFNAGIVSAYTLPGSMDMPALSRYIENTVRNNSKTLGDNQSSPLESYLAGEGQYIRIRSQMADVGTNRMKELTRDVEADIKEIFGDDDSIEIILSGASLVIMKGTDYLLKNLFGSLVVAILLIAGIMAMLFKQWKMVIISLVPNILPMLFTAGLMGLLEIPVKASTCLIFSVAFGISVDDTIHYLAKYRQELKHFDGKVKEAAMKALEETGISMAYTSIILFFGFSIFMASDFGGTVSLGVLVSITLVLAMFTNLTLLPALLLSFHKKEIDNEYKKYPEVFEDDEEEENINGEITTS